VRNAGLSSTRSAAVVDSTASDLVALAKRAGATAYSTDWVIPGRRLIVRTNGELTWLYPADGAPLQASWLPAVVFDLLLDASNTASPEALTRALLASAATFDVCDGYRATIGDESIAVEPDTEDGDGRQRRIAEVSDREAQALFDDALSALLDSLLAEVA